MRRVSIDLMVLLSLLLLVAPHTRAEGLDDELRLEDSFELLHLEMKLAAVRQLESRGFYIAPGVLERCRKDCVALAESLEGGASGGRREVRTWMAEDRKTAKAQKQALLKLADAWGRKVLRAVAEEARFQREAQQAEREYQRARKRGALEAARYVERLAQDYHRHVHDRQEREWKHAARQAYCGAIDDREDLVAGIRRLNTERAAIGAALATIDHVCHRLTQIEKLQAFHASPTGYLLAEAEARTLEYLNNEYPTADHATINFAVQKTKLIVTNVRGTAKTLSKLDKDRNLRAYPDTLKMAKRFAVLGAVYNTASGIARDLDATVSLGPLFDVIDYYGKTIASIPTVAQTMSKLAARAAQDVLGARGVTHWRRVHGELWKSGLLRHFGVQIAAGSMAEDGGADTYYLIVDPAIASEGYVQLDARQYGNLARALCYERLIHARKEASAGFINWVIGAMAGEESAMAARPDKDYLQRLSARAAANRFTDKQLLALANARTVSIDGTKWSLEELKARADGELRRMADELTVRRALRESGLQEDYSHLHRQRWAQFKALLRNHSLRDEEGRTHMALLSPDRILSMFTFFLENPNRAIVDSVFAEQTRKLMAQRLGIPKLGVPLIRVSAEDQVRPGRRERAEVTLIVGDLRPGRRVDVALTLHSPDWGGRELASTRMSVGNGGHQARMAFTVPPGVSGGAHRLHCEAVVPATDYHERIETTGWVTVTVDRSLTYTGRMRPELQPMMKKALARELQSHGGRLTQATFSSTPLTMEVTSDEVRPQPVSMSLSFAGRDEDESGSVRSNVTWEFGPGRLAPDGTASGTIRASGMARGRVNDETFENTQDEKQVMGTWRAEPRGGGANEYNFYLSDNEDAPVVFILRPVRSDDG
mgnify:FL=1